MNTGEILYEVSYQFDFLQLMPIVLLIFGILLPKNIIKSYETHGEKINKAFVKFFSLTFSIIASVFVVITVILEIVSYNKIIVAYRSGNYNIVEGYVENYSPMPYEGHSDEYFTINNIKFSYSDYEITQGYHNAASHGGVITHNGQHLKLRYITMGLSNQNIIVYIEELP